MKKRLLAVHLVVVGRIARSLQVQSEEGMKRAK